MESGYKKDDEKIEVELKNSVDWQYLMVQVSSGSSLGMESSYNHQVPLQWLTQPKSVFAMSYQP